LCLEGHSNINYLLILNSIHFASFLFDVGLKMIQ